MFKKERERERQRGSKEILEAMGKTPLELRRRMCPQSILWKPNLSSLKTQRYSDICIMQCLNLTFT